jgi:hypothetical protein
MRARLGCAVGRPQMSETPRRLKPAVLVVEDEAQIRLSGVAIAEAAGFQAIGVSKMDEALCVQSSPCETPETAQERPSPRGLTY